mmetsp:Transcript_101559/g.327460  ORF Transcript_101559/g.327460 Transcript_101559/m.327460 type:complete len:1000 (-) Transcript_101559:24-3023(-)
MLISAYSRRLDRFVFCGWALLAASICESASDCSWSCEGWCAPGGDPDVCLPVVCKPADNSGCPGSKCIANCSGQTSNSSQGIGSQSGNDDISQSSSLSYLLIPVVAAGAIALVGSCIACYFCGCSSCRARLKARRGRAKNKKPEEGDDGEDLEDPFGGFAGGVDEAKRLRLEELMQREASRDAPAAQPQGPAGPDGFGDGSPMHNWDGWFADGGAGGGIVEAGEEVSTGQPELDAKLRELERKLALKEAEAHRMASALEAAEAARRAEAMAAHRARAEAKAEAARAARAAAAQAAKDFRETRLQTLGSATAREPPDLASARPVVGGVLGMAGLTGAPNADASSSASAPQGRRWFPFLRPAAPVLSSPQPPAAPAPAAVPQEPGMEQAVVFFMSAMRGAIAEAAPQDDLAQSSADAPESSDACTVEPSSSAETPPPLADETAQSHEGGPSDGATAPDTVRADGSGISDEAREEAEVGPSASTERPRKKGKSKKKSASKQRHDPALGHIPEEASRDAASQAAEDGSLGSDGGSPRREAEENGGAGPSNGASPGRGTPTGRRSVELALGSISASAGALRGWARGLPGELGLLDALARRIADLEAQQGGPDSGAAAAQAAGEAGGGTSGEAPTAATADAALQDLLKRLEQLERGTLGVAAHGVAGVRGNGMQIPSRLTNAYRNLRGELARGVRRGSGRPLSSAGTPSEPSRAEGSKDASPTGGACSHSSSHEESASPTSAGKGRDCLDANECGMEPQEPAWLQLCDKPCLEDVLSFEGQVAHEPAPEPMLQSEVAIPTLQSASLVTTDSPHSPGKLRLFSSPTSPSAFVVGVHLGSPPRSPDKAVHELQQASPVKKLPEAWWEMPAVGTLSPREAHHGPARSVTSVFREKWREPSLGTLAPEAALERLPPATHGRWEASPELIYGSRAGRPGVQAMQSKWEDQDLGTVLAAHLREQRMPRGAHGRWDASPALVAQSAGSVPPRSDDEPPEEDWRVAASKVSRM